MTEASPVLFLDDAPSKSRKALVPRRGTFDDLKAQRRPGILVAARSSELRSAVGELRGPVRRLRHGLLVLEPMSPALQNFAERLFASVVSPDHGIALLPREELLEALAAPHLQDLFIGGVVDEEGGEVHLYRGNLELVVVPLDWFQSRSAGPKPDPKRFRVCDFGQTVALGGFEASADAIFYEFDSDYRARLRKRQLSLETGLGASIRRLRLMRGVARADFSGISEKQIARIERGEIEAPRPATLKMIAKRLRVKLDELDSY